VRPHRVASLVALLGCLALGALAPAAGCNGTGTTPICNFPDGANNPESGCGELVEAAAAADAQAPPVDAPSDTAAPDSPVASDATVPDAGADADAHVPDTGTSDVHVVDANADAADAKG
jgi:hypothetical protein